MCSYARTKIIDHTSYVAVSMNIMPVSVQCVDATCEIAIGVHIV